MQEHSDVEQQNYYLKSDAIAPSGILNQLEYEFSKAQFCRCLYNNMLYGNIYGKINNQKIVNANYAKKSTFKI